MYRPPLRGRPALADKKVLLIDRCQATREARAAVLRSHGVEVHEAEEISRQRDFCGNLMSTISSCSTFAGTPARKRSNSTSRLGQRDPRQRIVFLTGPPKYVSRTWPGEIAEGDTSRGQWGETVKRFLAAA